MSIRKALTIVSAITAVASRARCELTRMPILSSATPKASQPMEKVYCSARDRSAIDDRAAIESADFERRIGECEDQRVRGDGVGVTYAPLRRGRIGQQQQQHG